MQGLLLRRWPEEQKSKPHTPRRNTTTPTSPEDSTALSTKHCHAATSLGLPLKIPALGCLEKAKRCCSSQNPHSAPHPHNLLQPQGQQGKNLHHSKTQNYLCHLNANPLKIKGKHNVDHAVHPPCAELTPDERRSPAGKREQGITPKPPPLWTKSSSKTGSTYMPRKHIRPRTRSSTLMLPRLF